MLRRNGARCDKLSQPALLSSPRTARRCIRGLLLQPHPRGQTHRDSRRGSGIGGETQQQRRAAQVRGGDVAAPLVCEALRGGLKGGARHGCLQPSSRVDPTKTLLIASTKPPA
eukprot:366365-Chlamydomonas_euryale.AAC.4